MRRVKVEESGCWTWQLWTDPKGYGRMSERPGRTVIAHRWAYRLLVGEIPAGLTLDHLCRNRSCVNPQHLEPVTQYVNNMRGNSITAIEKRKTHCIRGHEFNTENTRVRANGQRECRPCDAWRARQRRAAA